MPDKLGTSCADIYLKDGILWWYVLSDAVIETNDMEEIISASRKIIKKNNNVRLPLYIDIRKLDQLSHKVRMRFSPEKASKHISGCAVLVDSLATRITATFFVKFHKPSFPIKLFNKEADAIKWLRDL
jgi:hypothetical protein